MQKKAVPQYFLLKGSATAEFALVLPSLCFVLLILMSLFSVSLQYLKTSNLVREIARIETLDKSETEKRSLQNELILEQLGDQGTYSIENYPNQSSPIYAKITISESLFNLPFDFVPKLISSSAYVFKTSS